LLDRQPQKGKPLINDARRREILRQPAPVSVASVAFAACAFAAIAASVADAAVPLAAFLPDWRFVSSVADVAPPASAGDFAVPGFVL
jgi:hypothetical protein